MICETSIPARAAHLPRMRRSALLKTLGLPKTARREAALKLAVARIVTARRNGNEEAAVFWSEAKNFLKRNLKHLCLCGCGSLLRGGVNQCQRSQIESLAKAARERKHRDKANDGALRDAVEPLSVVLSRCEVSHITQAIEICGSKDKAADVLGISKASLYRKLSREK